MNCKSRTFTEISLLSRYYHVKHTEMFFFFSPESSGCLWLWKVNECILYIQCWLSHKKLCIRWSAVSLHGILDYTCIFSFGSSENKQWIGKFSRLFILFFFHREYGKIYTPFYSFVISITIFQIKIYSNDSLTKEINMSKLSICNQTNIKLYSVNKFLKWQIYNFSSKS